MAVVDWGKPAQTCYEVVEEFEGYSLLRLDLKTGRTHQIRVHMSYIGHPVVGDRVYGRCKFPIPAERQLLHAERLEFKHPLTGRWLSLRAPWPEDLVRAVEFLRGREQKVG
jgi:23S rRNA pseudouridine1911/1915/1917 synthase